MLQSETRAEVRWVQRVVVSWVKRVVFRWVKRAVFRWVQRAVVKWVPSGDATRRYGAHGDARRQIRRGQGGGEGQQKSRKKRVEKWHGT